MMNFCVKKIIILKHLHLESLFCIICLNLVSKMKEQNA